MFNVALYSTKFCLSLIQTSIFCCSSFATPISYAQRSTKFNKCSFCHAIKVFFSQTCHVFLYVNFLFASEIEFLFSLNILKHKFPLIVHS